MSKGAAFYCDLCEDGPYYGHPIIGLYVVEDVGCIGTCEPLNADKHVCRQCAGHIADAIKPPKKAKGKKPSQQSMQALIKKAKKRKPR